MNADAVIWNFQILINEGHLPFAEYLAGIEKLDGLTVKLDYTQYNNQLIQAWGSTAIFSQYSWNLNSGGNLDSGRKWACSNVVGTGPFKLVEFNRGQSMTLAKNPNYWRPGLPYLNGIEISYVRDTLSAHNMLLTGQVEEWDYVPVDNQTDLEKAGFLRVGDWTTYLVGLCPNTADPDSIWNNQTLRQVLDYAIDKQALAKDVGHGYYTVMTTLAPPGEWGYDPNYPARSYDPGKARQLLAAAGYPNGLKTTLLINNDPTIVALGTYIKRNLDSVGIQTTLDTAAYVRYQEAVWGNKPSPGLCLMWASFENNYLSTYLKTFSTNPSANLAYLSHTPEQQALDSAATVVVDIPGQKSITADIVKYMTDEARIIPLYSDSSAIMVQNYVHTDRFSQGLKRWQSENTWMENDNSIPSLISLPAVVKGVTVASLNAYLFGLGNDNLVNVSFEYGTTASYGSSTPAQIQTAPGPFCADIIGLTPDTTYHFRAKVEGNQIIVGSDLTFTTPGGIISGHVFRADGITPVKDASVTASHLNVSLTTETSSEGSYSIFVPSGSYQVVASASGYITEYYDGVYHQNASKLVTVSALETTPDIDFTLEIGGSISGHIFRFDSITPLVNAYVVAESPGFFYGHGSFTDADGSYRLTGLPTGNYEVTASTPGFNTGYYNITNIANHFSWVSIVAPQDTPDINIKLDAINEAPIKLNPASLGPVAAGQTFNLDIQTNISPNQAVDEVKAYISFNPAVLEVINAEVSQPGIQITPGDNLTTVITNNVNNTSGLISFNASQLNLPFPIGNFTVATIQFRVKAVPSNTNSFVTISLSGNSSTSEVNLGGTAIPGAHANTMVQVVTGAIINFNVGLQGGGRPDSGWAVPLTVKFFTPGMDVLTAIPLYSFNLTAAKSGNAAGAQVIGISPGTYDITAVSPHC